MASSELCKWPEEVVVFLKELTEHEEEQREGNGGHDDHQHEHRRLQHPG